MMEITKDKFPKCGADLQCLERQRDRLAAENALFGSMEIDAHKLNIQLIAQAQELRAENARLREALGAFRHADGCWCDAAFGMPDGSHTRHSDACDIARSIINKEN